MNEKMSKFEELCQAYALAKQHSQTDKQACYRFVEGFIAAMSDYFQTPIKQQQDSFDKTGLMQRSPVIFILPSVLLTLTTE